MHILCFSGGKHQHLPDIFSGAWSECRGAQCQRWVSLGRTFRNFVCQHARARTHSLSLYHTHTRTHTHTLYLSITHTHHTRAPWWEDEQVMAMSLKLHLGLRKSVFWCWDMWGCGRCYNYMCRLFTSVSIFLVKFVIVLIRWFHTSKHYHNYLFLRLLLKLEAEEHV